MRNALHRGSESILARAKASWRAQATPSRKFFQKLCRACS